MTSNLFHPYNFPHAKAYPQELSKRYFNDAAFTKILSGESAEASFTCTQHEPNKSLVLRWPEYHRRIFYVFFMYGVAVCHYARITQ